MTRVELAICFFSSLVFGMVSDVQGTLARMQGKPALVDDIFEVAFGIIAVVLFVLWLIKWWRE